MALEQGSGRQGHKETPLIRTPDGRFIVYVIEVGELCRNDGRVLYGRRLECPGLPSIRPTFSEDVPPRAALGTLEGMVRSGPSTAKLVEGMKPGEIFVFAEQEHTADSWESS
ncbi:MAG: hypothetical protein Q7S60_04875 [bacterium]|nr:hypothetical protein [bacterium]